MKLELEFQSPDSSVSREYTAYGKDAADASELLQSGIGYAKEGDREAARHFLLRVVDAEPENEDAWLWLAATSHYPEELLVFLQNVLKINPANERALEWQKATKTLLAATLVERGASASHQNQKEYANQCFVQALLHDNQNETAWLSLAANADSPEEKISHFQKVLKINPANESALASLKSLKQEMSQSLLKKANFAAISGERHEARELLDAAMESAPELEEAWILKAYLADDSEGKVACYEKILALNPENEMAQAGLASEKAMMHKSAEKKSNAQSLKEVFAHSGNDLSFVEESVASELSQPDETVLVHAETENLATFGEQAFENSFQDSPQTFSFESEPAQNFVLQPFEEPTDELDVRFLDEVKAGGGFSEEQPLEIDVNETESLEDCQFDAPENENQISAAVPEQVEILDASAIDVPADEKQDSPEFFFEQIDYLEEVSDSSEIQILGEDEEDEIIDQDFPQIADLNDELATFSNPTAGQFEESQLPNLEENVLEGGQNSYSYEAAFLEGNSSVSAQTHSESFAPNNQYSEQAASENGSFEVNSPAPAGVSAPESTPAETLADKAVPRAESNACPFCYATHEPQAFVCDSCNIMFSLSDLEMLLSHAGAQTDVLEMAIEDLESERFSRRLSEGELLNLGIAHLNAKNLRKGLNCLQEAAQMNPNDIVLGSKVNFLAIRLSEIEAHESKLEGASSSRPLTIMVVDDSPTVRKLISGKLEKSGHTVVAAADGSEALDKIKEIQPDLILLDIMMPQMDGYQVCKLIRSHAPTRDVPVIMISGKDGFFDKVRGRMAGTTGYITKPFGPETLMRTIESYVV